MITNSKEKLFPAAKQEGPSDERLHKAPTSTSRQWSSAGFRNPRIVRVSRTFGGKDRHSKVCTVRGLRDRRIRLSVPTAVQLYYLQDRLGLSQPSKVIDWLIDATKQDIDKLPPLQIPQGVFGQFLHHHHHDHDHQHLDLLPQLDHHQAKTNEQDQFAQKLFGNMSSSYMNCYQNSGHTSFLGHGIALPQIDGSHTNLAVMSNCSTSLFNSPSLQSQLFFRAPPPPSNISTTSSIFGPPYPPYITSIHHENPHDPIRSQIINSHVQLLSASNTSASTSANTSASSSSSHQYQHLLHHSLMSSLHSTSTAASASANINHNPPLIKSFPALFNPRLLAQSSSTVYENRLEKDRTAG